MKTVCLSGAGGFAGAHCLEHILATTDWRVVATDSFRHRGKTDRIAQILEPHPEWKSRLQVFTHDLSAPFTEQMIHLMGPVDYVIAMASDSHVDRSIADPVQFTRNNVNVILSTLEFCRDTGPKHVIVISTDEVYGPTDGTVNHGEWAPIIPSNPYAASKASQEAIAAAYWRTYGVPVTIINCMNLFGERQDTEKFIPKLVRGITRGEQVTIHGSQAETGSRYWLHARNLADALLYIFTKLPPVAYPNADRPDRYNIAGPDRVSNLDLAQMVASIAGRTLWYRFVGFDQARLGHDPHYGLDPSKLAGAGWKPPVPFAESLDRTVRWTLANPEWIL